ncbi:MAG: hypothetical protein L6437_05695, partial [Kiritimatiellae bacterium]|nr:hypothetical protein [Kiritimatiellia bacterium]
RILDLCLLDHEFPDGSLRDAELEKFLPEVITGMPDFESLYGRVLDTLKEAIKLGADWLRIVGYHTRFIHPCPLFSTTLLDCIERGTDYTAGGARYNPAGIALVGLGTVVDSLTAIRYAVYDEGWLSFEALRKHLADNWAGAEDIRQRIISLPKYGHGEPEVDRLAARISRELAEFCRTLVNERGGHYQPSFFVYYHFQWMGKIVRATPDGRRAGDMLSQGCAPGRLRSPKSLTDIIRSVSMIDFVNYPGNAVLDMQLPLSVDHGMPLSDFVSLLRAFVNLGGPTLQPNCVSVDALRDAKAHPDKHRDLLVRISGLSAWFVTLHEDVQDEIIERYMVNV